MPSMICVMSSYGAGNTGAGKTGGTGGSGATGEEIEYLTKLTLVKVLIYNMNQVIVFTTELSIPFKSYDFPKRSPISWTHHMR